MTLLPWGIATGHWHGGAQESVSDAPRLLLRGAAGGCNAHSTGGKGRIGLQE